MLNVYRDLKYQKNTTIDSLGIREINKNDKTQIQNSGCLCRRIKERTGGNIKDRGQVYRASTVPEMFHLG